MYTTSQVAAIHGVSRETVRVWSETFQHHLGLSALPGKGRQRNFSVEDMTVLNFIAEQRRQGVGYDEIDQLLQEGKRAAPPTISPQEAAESTATNENQRLHIQLTHLKQALEVALEDRERAIAEYETLITRAIKAETKSEYLQERIARLEADNKELQQEINTLRQSLGRLEGRLGQG